MRILSSGTAAGIRRAVAAAGLVAGFLWTNPAFADGMDYHESVRVPPTPAWLTLPVEYGHGAAWTRHADGPAYRFTGSVLPGLVAGPWTFHLALQVVYRNPEWDMGIGGRITLRVLRLASGILPARLLVEASHHPIHPGGYVAGGGALGLGSLLQLAALYGHDTDRPSQFFAVRIGVDILSLWDPVGAIIRDVPESDIPGRVCPPGRAY